MVSYVQPKELVELLKGCAELVSQTSGCLSKSKARAVSCLKTLHLILLHPVSSLGCIRLAQGELPLDG